MRAGMEVRVWSSSGEEEEGWIRRCDFLGRTKKHDSPRKITSNLCLSKAEPSHSHPSHPHPSPTLHTPTRLLPPPPLSPLSHLVVPPSPSLSPPFPLSPVLPPSCPLSTTRTPTKPAPRRSMPSSSKQLVTGTSRTLASFTRREERTSIVVTRTAGHLFTWPLAMVVLAWFGTSPKRLALMSTAWTALAGLPPTELHFSAIWRSLAFSWRREARTRTRRTTMVGLLCTSQRSTASSSSSSGWSRREALTCTRQPTTDALPSRWRSTAAPLPSCPSSSTGPSASSPRLTVVASVNLARQEPISVRFVPAPAHLPRRRSRRHRALHSRVRVSVSC